MEKGKEKATSRNCPYAFKISAESESDYQTFVQANTAGASHGNTSDQVELDRHFSAFKLRPAEAELRLIWQTNLDEDILRYGASCQPRQSKIARTGSELGTCRAKNEEGGPSKPSKNADCMVLGTCLAKNEEGGPSKPFKKADCMVQGAKKESFFDAPRCFSSSLRDPKAFCYVCKRKRKAFESRKELEKHRGLHVNNKFCKNCGMRYTKYGKEDTRQRTHRCKK